MCRAHGSALNPILFSMKRRRALRVCAKTNVGQEAQFKQNALTLTLSRPTGEGTARSVSCTFYSGWIGRPTEDDSPSPIRWERAGVRVSPSQNPTFVFARVLSTQRGEGRGEGVKF